MYLVSSCSCLCPRQWSQVSNREWRCSWSSADRWCSNYIWVIDNFIAHYSAFYITDLTVGIGEILSSPYSTVMDRSLSRTNLFDWQGANLACEARQIERDWYGLTLIATWINIYIVWDEITCPFSKFSCCPVQVWERINNVITHYIMEAINCPCRD